MSRGPNRPPKKAQVPAATFCRARVSPSRTSGPAGASAALLAAGFSKMSIDEEVIFCNFLNRCSKRGIPVDTMVA
jgi:hypothetical protein